jgi:hypothetical protein
MQSTSKALPFFSADHSVPVATIHINTLNANDRRNIMVCTPKVRTISKEQKDNLVQKFIEMYEDKNGLTVEIDVKDVSHDLNVSIPLAKDIFIEAYNKGLNTIRLKNVDRSVVKHDKQRINSKGNFILPKDTLSELNENLAEERKFKVGDKFNVTLDGEKIILDRVPCELPQEQDAPSDAA